MTDYYRLPLGANAPDVVNAVIEIPKGSRNKYEYDVDLGVFMLDRVLSSSMVYDVDYGFMPSTLAGDGDPADVLLLMEEPTFTGCIVPARPVGMMKMEDSGEDFKILCVPTGDKRYNHIHRLEDVSPHRLLELEYFFRSYKTLDGSFPDVAGWRPENEAREYVLRCREAFSRKYGAAKVS